MFVDVDGRNKRVMHQSCVFWDCVSRECAQCDTSSPGGAHSVTALLQHKQTQLVTCAAGLPHILLIGVHCTLCLYSACAAAILGDWYGRAESSGAE